MKYFVLLSVFLSGFFSVEVEGDKINGFRRESDQKLINRSVYVKNMYEKHNMSTTCTRCCSNYNVWDKISSCISKCTDNNGCNIDKCHTAKVCPCPLQFSFWKQHCKPSYLQMCQGFYCSFFPEMDEDFSSPVEVLISQCSLPCQENTTADCCHLSLYRNELFLHSKNEILVPMGMKALTFPTDCGAMNNRTGHFSGVLFKCHTNFIDESAFSFCYMVSEKYQPAISNNGTHTNETLHVNFIFAYTVDNNSAGTCELCFCDDILYVNKINNIRLCPCVGQPQPSQFFFVESLALYGFLLVALILLLLMITLITYKVASRKENTADSKPSQII